MTTPPDEPIPASIRLFIERHTGEPTAELLAAFTPTASVTDEGRTVVGRDAIEAWLRAASAKYTYTLAVTGHVAGRLSARLEGDFPGGVADLAYAYELDANGRIARLVID